MPTVAGFLCYMKGLAPKNKKGLAFASYGWGGQSAKEIDDQLKGMGFEMIADPVKVQYIPAKEKLAEITKQIAEIVE